MSTILLSIKPEFSEKIFDGTKKYEFRKRIARKKVEKIVVYATSPVKKIIGEVDVEDVLTMKPALLWETTKDDAGIEKQRFIEYFSDNETGYAYKLKNAKIYNTPETLSKYNIKQAPQSFVYIEK